jgi:hypothetical protein
MTPQAFGVKIYLLWHSVTLGAPSLVDALQTGKVFRVSDAIRVSLRVYHQNDHELTLWLHDEMFQIRSRVAHNDFSWENGPPDETQIMKLRLYLP